ncbi:cadherin-like domain-containing protein [Leptolyngbya sp. NK1-12]|uniref:Cadherin-like domain-containing protein n=1 Tax=Leptolyngbya sp. NK1-12 TaxID=2547451 RepID=A0AA96WAG0_9CYAN|nr:cadherin-like domain-containing protein [Elainella sp. C42_A2020_010]WNZ21418.1 cadherin-like domain-containing protein [Leptolyngbya sp. NK1-12]
MKIGFTANPTTLIEDQKTTFTLTFTLDQLPPSEGLLVSIDSDIPRALAELDVFAAEFSGVRLTGANADASGLTLRITQQTATITLPVFDDDQPEGTELFTYTIQPSSSYTVDPNAASVTLTILDQPAPNQAPVANPDSYSTTADTTLTIAAAGLLANDTDADGNALTAALVTPPSNGRLTLNPDGSFTYSPNAGFSGTDQFTYQANDGTVNSSPATVSLTVTAAPAPSPPGTILGTAGRDLLRGTPNSDRIEGLGGNDQITGLGGNDLLLGGAGADRIVAGAGDDQIFGGTGNNRLTGGQGRDRFGLEAGAGRSLITDFQDGQDRLGLVGFSFGELEITQRGRNTLIRSGDDLLAILSGVQPNQLTRADFIQVSVPT